MKICGLNIVSILAGLVFIAGCSSSRPIGKYSDSFDEPVVIYGERFAVVRNPLTLSDFLNRVPGVQVLQNRVMIRGLYPPLFVIDDVPLGNSYSDVVRLINVFDIQSVEVIRDLSRTTRYGSRAAKGVIIIRTWMPEKEEIIQ